MSQWAEENRILDVRSSAMPGLWRNSVTPYLSEIMDTISGTPSVSYGGLEND